MFKTDGINVQTELHWDPLSLCGFVPVGLEVVDAILTHVCYTNDILLPRDLFPEG